MQIALQEALLRRKELTAQAAKIAQVMPKITETRTGRKPAVEGLDDVIAEVSRLTLAEARAEHDFVQRQLRVIDAAVQRANWETQINVDPSVMADFHTTEGGLKALAEVKAYNDSAEAIVKAAKEKRAAK